MKTHSERTKRMEHDIPQFSLFNPIANFAAIW